MDKLKILHMYPAMLDLYGDSGNVEILSYRCKMRGIETELCIQGTEDDRYSFCIKEMYDNCRETITNALRYSEADRIDVILKFLEDRVEMYILDNGKGCKEISEHNGLRGIRERTEGLGGSVRFSSVSGEGFNTIIKIPIKEVQI